jgi:2-polyprenyl-3-methyl-5-hydroxy-6-metoxy-1,4-benzoquinol methylase
MNKSNRRLLFISLIKGICPPSLRPFARDVFIFYNCLKNKWVSAVYSVLAFVQPGRAVLYCPCCNSWRTDFIIGGYKKRSDFFDLERYNKCRQDVLCPTCRSLPRHRILANWCEEYKDQLQGKLVLYFALENCMSQWLKRNSVTVTSADLFETADLILDLDNIEQPDESWDVVFCNHVLEHVPNYKKALSELHRILKPDGMLICSFPIDFNYETEYEDASLVNDDSPEGDKMRIQKFGQKDHLRVFGRYSRQLLECAGFDVTVIDGDSMPAEILPVVGPADYDSNKLFVCEKKG